MSQVRQSLQELVASALANPAAGHGYAAAGFAFGPSVEVRLEKGGAGFALWLEPADAEKRSYKRTARFNVGHRGEPPDRLGYTVLDDLCARLAVWEQGLDDTAQADLFAAPAASEAPTPAWLPHLEWLAVSSGLKAASRSVANARQIDELLAEARRRGLHAAVSRADAFIAGFCAANAGMDAIVYTARDAAALRAVTAAEQAMIEADARRERASAEQVHALGAALGYPACCIDAFLAVRDLPNGAIRFQALRRTTGAASFLLNDTIEGRVLVSHAVCRYDCAPSIAYGRALLAELSRADAQGAGELEQRLRGLAILFATGSALRLVPARGPQSARLYRFTAVESCGEDTTIAEWQTALEGADAVELSAGSVTILRGDARLADLAAPPDQIQPRLFE